MKRPLTQDEIAAADAAGYDMSGYDGKPVDLPDDLYGQPAKTSSVAAAGRSALASAIPTAAGGAGFAGGMKAGLALPIPHPLGKLAAGIIGGLIGGYTSSKLAAKGQEALMPEEWEQSLASSASEHPTATTVGQLATLPLGGLRPSISGTRDVLTALPRLATLGPKGLSAAEAQALKLAAGGAALGAGQEAVVAPLEGRDITAPHLLEAAGLGATFTRPMKFAQKYYGFHDIPQEPVADPELMRAVQQKGRPVAAPVEPTAAPVAAAKPAEVVEAPPKQTVVPPATTVATTPINAPTGEARMKYIEHAGNEIWQKMDQFRKLKHMLGDDPKYATDKAKIDQQMKDLKAQVAADPELAARVKSIDKYMAKRAAGKAQGEDEGLTTPKREEVIAGLKAANLSHVPSDAYEQILTNFLKKKNIKVTENNELVDKNGKPLKGQALLDQTLREILYNPPHEEGGKFVGADISTKPHEGLHFFRRELEHAASNGDKQAVKLLEQWDSLIKPGFDKITQAKIAAGKELDPIQDDIHEFTVSEQGFEFIKQQFNLLNESTRTKWWNDTKALLKTKWSKNATLDDLQRAINFRYVAEQGRGRYVGKEGPLGPVGKQGIAGLGVARSSEDVDAYNEIQRQMKEMLKSGNIDDFNRLWKENEIIKNRHGGMPPTDEGAPRNQVEDEGLATNKEFDLARMRLYKMAREAEKAGNNELMSKLDEVMVTLGQPWNTVRNQPSDEGLPPTAGKYKDVYNEGFTPTFGRALRDSEQHRIHLKIQEYAKKGINSSNPEVRALFDRYNELGGQLTAENSKNFTGKEGDLYLKEGNPRYQPLNEGLPPERAGQPGEKPDVEGLKTFITAKLITQAEAAEKAGNTDIANELRAMIKDVEGRKQGEDEGLPTDYGEPVGAERILLDAAKRTRPYLEWISREKNSQRDTSDKAFFRAIMDNDLLRDDIMTEPQVMHALKETTTLPEAKPEAPKKVAVEKVVSNITAPATKEGRPALTTVESETPIAPIKEKGKPLPISEETGQPVKPLKAKESTLISMDEARANAARLANQVLDPGPYAPGVERRGQRAKIPSTTAEESARRVIEASEKYIEERRKKGRFQPEDEGLSPYMKESQELHKQVEALEIESRKHEEKINEFYTKSGLGDKIETLATKIYGVPEKDSGWTGQDELEMALHNLFRPYDVENAELNMGLSMPGLRAEGVSEHAQRVWGKAKAKFPNEASDIETLYQQMRNLSSYKDNQIINSKQIAIFKEIGNLWKKHDNRYQPASSGLPTTDVTAQSFVPGLASTFDKVRKLDTQLAEAGANWQARKDSYWGKVQTAEASMSSLPDKVVDSALKKLRDGVKTFTPQEQKAADAWKTYMKWNIDEHNKLGMPVKGIKAFADTEYVPDLLNREWIDLFTNKPNSPEAQNGKSLWADKAVLESKGALTRKEAYRNITSYIEALGRTSKDYLSVDFGAVRKAREYALPEGMRETSAKEILVRYGRSAASDMAMYREMEAIPEIQEKLGLRDPISGKLPTPVEGATRFSSTKEVKNMMSWVTGSIDEAAITHPYITGTARLVNNLLLGPGTGLRDTASIPVFAVPYLNKFSDLGAFAKGVLHYRENAAAALDTAAVQPHIDRVMMGDIATSPDRFLDILRKAATIARTGQGREAIENFNRKVVFSAGKELARNNVAGAKAGHKGSKQFLERFSTLIDGDVTTMKGKELDSALNQMAKNFTDANQGTYGGTGLPAWVSDSYLAPFLSLQKWSIEKSNTIFKDVVKPFYTGENRVPMLTYMLGSVLTGVGIQKLNEMISNKKASDPTYEEALAKGDASAITSQLATLMQLASYGGIVGDTMKVLSDAAKGKTPRNPLSFPAYSSTADAVTNIKNAANAINDGESPMEVLTELSTYLMSHNIQAARLASNFYNADDTARDQRFRDVRVFRELEHKPPTEPITPDRFGGLTARQFKRTGDVGEASEMLPGMIDKIISQSGDDPEEMRKRLRALKGNSYQTMPSLEDTPISFSNYYDHLVETQGQEAADKRLEDFIKQRMTNRLKSRLVPKF